ncbi:hypothetical protein Goshw_024875, partial [Gossypium schwendimanii]|nr:hypothetical protein [Gossypium schwendimanii]
KSNSDSQDKSEISAYTRNIKRNINSFRSLRIKHARRSANQLAHVIATESLRNGEEFYLEEKVPRSVVRIMEEEWIRARLRRKMSLKNFSELNTTAAAAEEEGRGDQGLVKWPL